MVHFILPGASTLRLILGYLNFVMIVVVLARSDVHFYQVRELRCPLGGEFVCCKAFTRGAGAVAHCCCLAKRHGEGGGKVRGIFGFGGCVIACHRTSVSEI